MAQITGTLLIDIDTNSKTRKIQSGRGIGLTLSKKVIELHDGKITVEANQKKGSIFSVLLPI